MKYEKQHKDPTCLWERSGIKKMRVSSYTIGAQVQDQPYFVLLHGYTGSLDKVPASLGSHLITNRGQHLQFSAMDCKITDETINVLKSRGYLTDLSHDEEMKIVLKIAATLHERDIRNSPTGFMIVPSYKCNLRCSYCFQSHDMHAGRDHFSQIMDREQVDQIFTIVDQFDEPGSVASALGLVTISEMKEETSVASKNYGSIGLFGGEPLLAETFDIVKYILAQANNRGRSLNAVTNGVELHLFESLLGPGKIEHLQITLDGAKRHHDTRRIGPEYKQTFESIIGNIELALSKGVKISTRMNIDSQNIDGIDELLDLFTERGWDKQQGFFAYAAAVHQEKQKQATVSRTDLVQITLKGNDKKSKEDVMISTYEKTADDTLSACLDGAGYPFRRSVFCSAETGLPIFDMHKNVYACWEDIGEERLRIATFNNSGLQFDVEAAGQWLTRFPGNISECANCQYALIHTSGCASHARKRTGTIFSSACESFKDFFPMTLGASYKRFEDNLRNDTN